MTGEMGFRSASDEQVFDRSSRVVVPDKKKIFDATHGRKIGDCVIIHSHPDQDYGVPGRIVGVSEDGTALVLERPQRYRLAERGYVVEPHTQTFSLEFGTSLRIVDVTWKALEGMVDQFPLVEHLGKDIIVMGPKDSHFFGRLESVYPDAAFLRPYAVNSSIYGDLWRLITDFPFPIDANSVVHNRLPYTIEEFVETQNERIEREIEEKPLIILP